MPGYDMSSLGLNPEVWSWRKQLFFQTMRGEGASKKYLMRATYTPTGEFVFWIAETRPDLTGQRSGYNPANLSSIGVYTTL